MVHGRRRHLAALTLVGWYLMMPPDSAKIPHEVESSAPLPRWSIVATYDTTEKCEAALADLQSKNRDPIELDTTGKLRRLKKQPPDPALATARAIGSGCVESDDFRLKGIKAATKRGD
ncbi:MAG TPA: hypothetical protein VNO74_03875 [Methylomirabilota bacterium]|nr:hypothetical protein [Methylomirabilota bacterium]